MRARWYSVADAAAAVSDIDERWPLAIRGNSPRRGTARWALFTLFGLGMLTYGLHVLYLLSYPPSVGADRRPGGPSVRAAAAAAEGPVAEELRRGIPAAHQMSLPAEAATAALPPPPPPPPPPKKRTVQSAAAARVTERLRRARQLDEEQATVGRTAMHPGDAAGAAASSSAAPPTALGPKLWSLLRLDEPWRNES